MTSLNKLVNSPDLFKLVHSLFNIHEMLTVHLALPRTQFALLLSVPVPVSVSVSVCVCVCVCVVSSVFFIVNDHKILGSAYEFLCGVVLAKFSLVEILLRRVD